jgi:desampylase
MLILSGALRDQLLAAARSAFPAECCGLLEGRRGEGAVAVTAIHPTTNVSPAPRDSFAIDPAAQFVLQRALRGTGREIGGCYHSHPNGRAEPSPRDCAGAGPDTFIWVIMAAGSADAIAAFEAPAFRPLAIRPGQGPQAGQRARSPATQ